MDRLPASIQTHAHNSRSKQHQTPIEKAQRNLPWRTPPPPIIDEQPEHAAQPIGKPACEERGDERKEVIKVWNGLSDDERDYPQSECDEHPGAD